MSNTRFSNTGSSVGKLRVLSINIEGRNGAWANRRTVLIDGIRAVKPDQWYKLAKNYTR